MMYFLKVGLLEFLLYIISTFHFHNLSILITVNILAISVILRVKDFSGLLLCHRSDIPSFMFVRFFFSFLIDDLKYAIEENLR